jgi:cytochrome c oxidase subunit 2
VVLFFKNYFLPSLLENFAAGDSMFVQGFSSALTPVVRFPQRLALLSYASPVVLHPQSHYARSISELTLWMLYISLAIFLLIVGLVSYAGWRYRAKPGEPDPKPVYGSLKWELIYLVPPTVLLAVIFGFMLHVMHASDPPAQSKGDDIVVTGHQWWWEVRYPKLGIVTANEIHIPAGRNTQFGFESADVIHDFWVPELGRKIDMIPGRHENIWLAADHPGTYLGTCAEFCGKEHAWMRIRVIADSPATFASWVAGQQHTMAAPQDSDEHRGLEDVTNMACANCHTISETSAQGMVGPNLTHVGSRETLAAGRLTNTPANLSAWLANPDQFKPGSHMPNLHLTAAQRNDLTAYLESLK